MECSSFHSGSESLQSQTHPCPKKTGCASGLTKGSSLTKTMLETWLALDGKGRGPLMTGSNGPLDEEVTPEPNPSKAGWRTFILADRKMGTETKKFRFFCPPFSVSCLLIHRRAQE